MSVLRDYFRLDKDDEEEERAKLLGRSGGDSHLRAYFRLDKIEDEEEYISFSDNGT